MPVGLRVFTEINRPDPELVAQLAQYHSADLSDAMNMAGTLDPAIRPAYRPIRKMAGPAITVAVPTGAQNVRKVAFETSRPGDVIVVNGYGAMHYAMLGDNIGRGLFHRGIAGMVMDGAFRDPSGFAEMGLPMFSRGTCTLPGPKDGPGEVNVPIACGGVVVNPGDIVVADEDGVVVIPLERANEVLERVAQLAAAFEAIQDQLRTGAVLNVAALQTKLKEGGWEFIDKAHGAD